MYVQLSHCLHAYSIHPHGWHHFLTSGNTPSTKHTIPICFIESQWHLPSSLQLCHYKIRTQCPIGKKQCPQVLIVWSSQKEPYKHPFKCRHTHNKGFLAESGEHQKPMKELYWTVGVEWSPWGGDYLVPNLWSPCHQKGCSCSLLALPTKKARILC